MVKKPKADLSKSKPPKEPVLEDGIHLLTLQECADYCRVHYHTFYKWVQDGVGPPIKQFTKQCIRVPKTDFIAWLNQGDHNRV